jgi:hypothetical protein
VGKRSFFVLIALFFICLVACQSRPDCESVLATATASASATGTPAPLTELQAQNQWQSSQHANSFVEDGANSNSSCARCHSPLDWQPVSDELPASWQLAGLSGVDQGFTISESEWSAIACEVCHPHKVEGIFDEIAWLAIPPLMDYQDITDARSLCMKCHLQEGEQNHKSLIFKGVHQDHLCTDCHDAHSARASCTSGCHQPFAQECEEIQTHDKPHSDVTCSACHDALGLTIGWNEDIEKWDTFIGGDPREMEDAEPFTSHAIELEVDCDRCHAPGDHPWDPK